MSYPQALTSLTLREAVADALYRAILGFDHYDLSMFNSAFTGEDVLLELRSGSEGKNRQRPHWAPHGSPRSRRTHGYLAYG
jgi:hypothetical protein